MKAYKLLRKLKNGDLKPLFINKTQVIPVGEWLQAENHPTRGYKERMGWHCTAKPNAPHLSMKGRVWCLVEIEDFQELHRPEKQGGTWLLANQMKVLREI